MCWSALFGNGRTALKFSVGRYVGKVGTDVAEASNPIVTGAWNSGFRAWVDSNRNYVIDCNLASGSLQVVPGGDFCGAADPDFYSGNNPNATEWDRSVTEGWAKRDHNWDFSTEIQQELRSNVALTAGWYHNTGGYFRAGIGITDNQSASRKRVVNNLGVTSADYDTYCFTAPSDARLPGGGGYQICDLADIKPTKYADLLAAKQLVTAREPFGDYQSYNDFFNITLNARLPRNITLGGGFDTGRSYFNSCFVVDSPQALLNCEITIPFKAQTQMKAHGIFPFPGDIVASFAFQNFSGPQITASYSATPAQIAASTLGRAPSSAGNLTIPLIKPQTMFEDRITRLDLRLSKIIRIKKLRVQANLDAYNVLNSGGIRSIISQFGPRWRNASQVLDPRLIQLGGQISF